MALYFYSCDIFVGGVKNSTVSNTVQTKVNIKTDKDYQTIKDQITDAHKEETNQYVQITCMSKLD